MKKFILFFCIAFIVLCNLSAESFSYNEFIERAAWDFSRSLGKNTNVAVMEIDAEFSSLSERIISDLESELSLAGCTILNRSNLDLINQELLFQTSGMVSDYSAVSIGHMLGAEKIIVGSAKNQVTHLRIELKLIDIETTMVSYQKSYDLKYDTVLNNIIKNTDAIGNQNIRLGVRFGAGIGFNKAHEDMIGTGITAKEEGITARVPAISFGYKLTEAFTAQLEMMFSLNGGIKVSGLGSTISVTFSSMEIPALLKFSVITNPIDLALFAGAYVSVPISQVIVENPYGAASVNPTGYALGTVVGFEVGVAAGPGKVFVDARYMKDLNTLCIKDDFGAGEMKQGVMNRATAHVSLGYAFAL